MATIKDVARLAKVSISTVSLALKDPSRASPETLRRINLAIEDVGYVANPVAQTLKSGKSRLIGMVFGSVTNPFFGEILQKVERHALDRNHLVVVSESRFDAVNELAVLRHLASQRVSGLILTPHGHGPNYVKQLLDFDIPLVTLDHEVEGLDADFIGSDNHLASSMLTQHLISLGHKKIAHIAGYPDLWTTNQRQCGFIDTMRSSGLSVDPKFIISGNYESDLGYDHAMRLLTAVDRPTAILAANNTTALGVLEAINDLGLQCPQDISLACFDDFPWSKFIVPRLTMAVQSTNDLAEIACQWIFDRIEAKGELIGPRRKILSPRLIVGQSCAVPSS